MCIGIPMQILQTFPGYAICQTADASHRIDTLLVGEQPPGTWLLTFLNTAREVISSEQAQQINDALTALERVMQGDGDIDHLFADLINREPELPAHLQPNHNPTESGS